MTRWSATSPSAIRCYGYKRGKCIPLKKALIGYQSVNMKDER